MALIATAAWTAVGSPAAASPPGLDVAGRHLARVAAATRSTLFGAIDLYSIEIFMQDHPATLEQARLAAAPKAVRVRRLVNGPANRRIPQAWKAALAEALSPREQHALEAALRQLTPDHDMWVIYSPEYGTTVTAGSRRLIAQPGDTVINAVLEIALLRSGISVELRRQLLRTPPAA